ncbi:VWA domain-containing protein [Variovorax sp. OV329]|uniref:VWA domain-containing protein n=1 Tax=Variovorax sp. OV329 TaxID=1882825 RepID=UPI000B86A037|nr:VWA domain-containing protein [Variovorax sp. OV329]
MYFLWPQFLWLLLAMPLLLALYVWLIRRRHRAALRYSSLETARAAVAGRQWRRHLPPALLLLALAGLAVAAARPVARVPLPWARTVIMMAMDVSLSMRVGDIEPTRMVAAQAAAKDFLRDVPRHIEVGMVTFAGSSHVARQPTLDRDSLAATVDAIQMQMGTAVGDAIVLCLAELFPEQAIDVTDLSYGNRASTGRSLDDKKKPPPREFKPVAPGSNNSSAIILLSDGRRTTGVDTLAAAKMAADRGVRIYVVGLGTVDGVANAPEGMSIYLQLDEPTLREVARVTGGQYHHAGTAEQLRSVYQNLGSRMEIMTRETELTGLLGLAACLVALVGASLSFLWFGRLA